MSVAEAEGGFRPPGACVTTGEGYTAVVVESGTASER